MEGTINVVEDSQMAQAEKSATHSTGSSQNGEKNVVNLGPRDSLHGRLDIQGDLRGTGNVTAKKRLTLGGSGHLNGDVKVARLTVEDGATLNGNVTMQSEKG